MEKRDIKKKINGIKGIKYLLISIIFFNIFSLILAAIYDDLSQSIIWGNEINLLSLKYWLYFFSWWSAWTSALTFIWGIWRMIDLKKRPSFLSQIFDITSLQSNIVSGFVFCLGGFSNTFPKTKKILINDFFFLNIKINNVQYWLFYNFFWHFLSPILFFIFFYKYSSSNLVRRNKRKGLLRNLINPFLYLFFVFSRPIIANMKKKGANNYSPRAYPKDYPYKFFFWCIGEDIGPKNFSKKNKSFLWSFIIILSIYLLSLLIFLLAIKKKVNDKKKLNNK